jgi:hypothetical protein
MGSLHGTGTFVVDLDRSMSFAGLVVAAAAAGARYSIAAGLGPRAWRSSGREEVEEERVVTAVVVADGAVVVLASKRVSP